MRKWIYLLICIIIVLVIGVFLQGKTKAEKELTCYRTLYNEDIIGKGCDEYFKNDAWYIEYMQLGKVEETMLEKIFSKMKEYGWNLYDWDNVYDNHYNMMQDLFDFLHLLDDYEGTYKSESEINLNDIDQQRLTDLVDFMSDFLRAINDLDKEGK